MSFISRGANFSDFCRLFKIKIFVIYQLLLTKKKLLLIKKKLLLAKRKLHQIENKKRKFICRFLRIIKKNYTQESRVLSLVQVEFLKNFVYRFAKIFIDLFVSINKKFYIFTRFECS